MSFFPNLISERKAAGARAPLNYGWMIFAALLFLVQALPYLSHRWVTDESWYAGPAYSLAHGDGMRDPAIGPNDLENHFDARPPGTAMVIAGAFRMFGEGQVAARLGSVLAGLLVVLLVYVLARDVIGDEGAVLAMLVLATDNLLVLVSRTARPEALTTLFVMLALLAVKQYRTRPSLLWPLSSGLLAAAGTMFHITLLGYLCSISLLAVVLDVRRKIMPLRGLLAFAGAYLVGLTPFAIWILHAPLGREGFREEYLSRAGGASLGVKFLHEAHRYADLLGFNILHGHGLDRLPLRLPIPLLFLTASYLLWRYRRNWFWVEVLLLLPTILWLIDTVNKSSRYLALLSPVFALAIGAGVAAVQGRVLLHRVMAVAAALVVVAQLGANAVLLRAARSADYTHVAEELRSVVPAGQTVYGTITFWLAFRDYPYISYERTDPRMAADDFHARYFVVGDRMMTNGGGMDEQYYKALNEHLGDVLTRATLLGDFPDPYYGDLKVYRIAAR